MAATFLLALLISAAIVKPITDWDAMSHWVIKAKVLSHVRYLDFSYTHHNYYPIFWPISLATQFIFLGQAYDPLVQWSSVLFFIVMLVQIINVLNFFKMKIHSIAFALLLFLTAFFGVNYMSTANAENIFLAYSAALVSTLILWLNPPINNRYFLLLFSMSIAITLIKFEGFLTSIFLSISLLLCMLTTAKDLKNKLWFALSLFFSPILLLLWIFWVNYNGYFVGKIYHLGSLFQWNKVIMILKMTHYTLFQSSTLMILTMAFIFMILRRNHSFWRTDERCLLLFSLFLYIFAIFFAFLGLNPAQIIVSKEVVLRLTAHAGIPLFILWCSLSFRNSPMK